MKKKGIHFLEMEKMKDLHQTADILLLCLSISTILPLSYNLDQYIIETIKKKQWKQSNKSSDFCTSKFICSIYLYPYTLPFSPYNASSFNMASHSTLPLDPMLSQFLKGFTSMVILSPFHQFLLLRAFNLGTHKKTKPNNTHFSFELLTIGIISYFARQ